jgi:hypothetical protein
MPDLKTASKRNFRRLQFNCLSNRAFDALAVSCRSYPAAVQAKEPKSDVT